VRFARAFQIHSIQYSVPSVGRIVIYEHYLFTAIPRPPRGLGRLTTTRCAKPRCAGFLGEKDGYVNVDGYGPNPHLQLKIHKYLDIAIIPFLGR